MSGLWSGLAPDSFGLIYDGVAPRQCQPDGRADTAAGPRPRCSARCRTPAGRWALSEALCAWSVSVPWRPERRDFRTDIGRNVRETEPDTRPTASRKVTSQ